MTQSALTIPLVPAQTEYAPRLTQVDFSFSKNFTAGHVRISPKLDIFNAFNSDDYTGVTLDAVRCGDLQAPVDDPAGPHHPHRRRPQVVEGFGR